MLSVCEAMLSHLGHTCELTTRLDDALGQVGSGFDLVLTDYRIGGESGLALVEALRDTGLPVILMSGHFDGMETPPEGVLACLEKPFDIDALESVLRSVLAA
jgi:DNA-binding NtrC family response regulator